MGTTVPNRATSTVPRKYAPMDGHVRQSSIVIWDPVLTFPADLNTGDRDLRFVYQDHSSQNRLSSFYESLHQSLSFPRDPFRSYRSSFFFLARDRTHHPKHQNLRNRFGAPAARGRELGATLSFVRDPSRNRVSCAFRVDSVSTTAITKKACVP